MVPNCSQDKSASCLAYHQYPLPLLKLCLTISCFWLSAPDSSSTWNNLCPHVPFSLLPNTYQLFFSTYCLENSLSGKPLISSSLQVPQVVQQHPPVPNSGFICTLLCLVVSLFPCLLRPHTSQLVGHLIIWSGIHLSHQINSM